MLSPLQLAAVARCRQCVAVWCATVASASHGCPAARRLCSDHMRADMVPVADGSIRRFCQKCALPRLTILATVLCRTATDCAASRPLPSARRTRCNRLHPLSEFDGGKRTCARLLADHNARRRATYAARRGAAAAASGPAAGNGRANEGAGVGAAAPRAAPHTNELLASGTLQPGLAAAAAPGVGGLLTQLRPEEAAALHAAVWGAILGVSGGGATGGGSSGAGDAGQHAAAAHAAAASQQNPSGASAPWPSSFSDWLLERTPQQMATASPLPAALLALLPPPMGGQGHGDASALAHAQAFLYSGGGAASQHAAVVAVQQHMQQQAQQRQQQ